MEVPEGEKEMDRELILRTKNILSLRKEMNIQIHKTQET